MSASYGTCLLLKDGRWRIDAEPHVILRLKRVFAGVAKKQHGIIYLADTEENCRDLLWFMNRYALETDPADHLEARAKAHRDRASLVRALLSGRRKPPDFDLTFPPREYQAIAADMILKAGSLLLADDVGLGKTLCAIATFTDHRTLPALVVTLTHLPKQWEAEIHRFAPTLRTHILRSTKPYDLTSIITRGGKPGQLYLAGAMPDVILTSYSKISGWAETLAGVVRSVVFDEVQELRHAKTAKGPTQKYSAAECIAAKCDFRTGLSATPFYNYGGEIYNVLQILKPNALGERSEFHAEWCKGGDGDEDSGDAKKPRIKNPKAFGSHLRETGLMIRRTRADVGRELPPLSKISHYVDCDTGALDEISGSAIELAKIILTQGEQKKGAKFFASEELSNELRQATGVGKAPYVAHFVRLLVEAGEKVLLYGWHHSVYDLWREFFAKEPAIPCAFYTGKESEPQKRAAKDSFLAGDVQVLAMSLRAGAGLDGLQGQCRTVVFGELDWSPGVHEQAIGRVYRDGQKDAVIAYFLVAEDGSDPIVADVLGVKKAQIDGVRDLRDDLLERLDQGDGNIKRLAEAFLRQRGVALPKAPPQKETGT